MEHKPDPTLSVPGEPKTADDVVRLFDHAILQPTSDDKAIVAELRSLRALPLASVCIKPYAVKLCVDELAGTVIATGTVISFPHGGCRTSIKAAEAEQAFADGAKDVDMVINIGKALSEDWGYVRDDIAAVRDVARAHKGVIKVIFETAYFTDDRLKTRLCEICSELAVDYVKTSTGYGYVRTPDGSFSPRGANEHDVALMRRVCPPSVGVKASGGVRTLQDTLRYYRLGARRIGTASSIAIHQEAAKAFGGSVSGQSAKPSASGY